LSLRNSKFIGKGVKDLGDEIDKKIKSANPKISKISREEYLDELKKGSGSSPLFICLRNAAAECEFYDSFENHSESVGKRIQDLTEKAPALSYFHVLANVAPAIGFFGTLIGMSHLLMGRALTAGESAEFARYISYFSQGLLQAIVTSIIGLFLLVLSMGVTFVFSKKAESIQNEMSRLAQEITDKVKL
ncbi:MAG: MotA/TolQ/ExbB proton channel family protein, partial [candidate division Zixibacteria bacterium]|nr:MotA/TolQ/ExbB proton channel family protein [candidate division Zixibacteria bacterium]